MDFKTISQAIDELSNMFGLQVLPESRHINMSSQFHTLKLYGSYLKQHSVLLRVKIGFDMMSNCLVNVQGISETSDLTAELINI